MAKGRSRKVQKPPDEVVEKENRFTFEVGGKTVEVKEIGLKETARLFALTARVAEEGELSWTPGESPINQIFKVLIAHMGDPEVLKELFSILTGKSPKFVEKHFQFGWGMAFLIRVLTQEFGSFAEFFPTGTESST